MRLPVFESVRVPARFGMLAMVTLSVSGALALGHFQLRERTRRAVGIGLMAGIIADTWMTHLPLPAVPDFWPGARADGFAAVLELPLGDVFPDLAATYRVTNHHHPLMNVNSGSEPPHYFTLRTALSEHDPAIFDGLPAGGRALIVVDRLADHHPGWGTVLAGSRRARRLA